MSYRRLKLWSVLVLALLGVVRVTTPCDVNLQGFIQNCGWNLLFPLGNPAGCELGEENMARNWVAPHDLTKEAPAVGETWLNIDFGGEAAATGFLAQAFYDDLSTTAPVWVDLDELDSLGFSGIDIGDTVDFQAIVDRLNEGLVGIPPIPSDNVLGIAQTFVDFDGSGNADGCIAVSAVSDGAIMVLVNNQVVLTRPGCNDLAVSFSLDAVELLDGINTITVLNWAGTGDDWGFRLGLTNLSGTLISNNDTATTGVTFLGSSPGGAVVDAGGTLQVTRTVERSDGCPTAGGLTVTLKGNGAGSGTADIVDVYSGLDISLADITNISNGGTKIETGGQNATSIVVSFDDVPVSVINSTGVTYDIAIDAGEVVRLTSGFSDFCVPTQGTDLLVGPPDSSSGPIGLFDDSHDIGVPDPNGVFGSLQLLAVGSDGIAGTTDDVYSLVGSGDAGISDSTEGDELFFAYERVSGDFSVTVEVTDLEFPTDLGFRARYGLLVRRDCSPTSQFSMVHANLTMEPDDPGVFWAFRGAHRTPGLDESQAYEFPDPDGGGGPLLENQPPYFRLERRGATFYGYASNDNVTWKPIGSNTWYGLEDDAELLVGFGYTIANSLDQGEVTFTNYQRTELPRVEIFDNDSNNGTNSLFTVDFSAVGDGNLPDGAESNCRSPCPFDPQVKDGLLRLTELTAPSAAAVSVFFDDSVPIKSGQLSIEYDVRFTRGAGKPGSGMTMTVVAGSDTSLVGGFGEDLGYEGLTEAFVPAVPSLSIEADAAIGPSDEYLNEGPGAPDSPGSWHLGINSGGNVDSVVINSVPLPDIFAPAGVHFRVVITSEGHVSVYVRPGDLAGGGGAGGGTNTEVLAAEAEVEPLSREGEEDGRVGFTASTSDGGMMSTDVGTTTVGFTDCSDNPETVSTFSMDLDGVLVFDASGSTAGSGDSDESLDFLWEVEGDARIEGPTDGDTARVVVVGDGEALLRVTVDDGRCDPMVVEIPVRPPLFKPGDVNYDGNLDISDAVTLIGFLFTSTELRECFVEPGSTPPVLKPAGRQMIDFNGDTMTDLSDAISILNFLFGTGDPHVLGTGCAELPSFCGKCNG